MSAGVGQERSVRALPAWRSVLAVVAHPDDESFGLGAVLSAFATARAQVHLLTFTAGEASTLGLPVGPLAEVRTRELRTAAAVLHASSVTLDGYPDGRLDQVPVSELAAVIGRVAGKHPVDGLIAFDVTGVTGHPDHVAATRAALAYGQAAWLPVLGWTLPRSITDQLADELGVHLSGRPPDEIDFCVRVDRDRQRRAARAHASQAGSQLLWRRLQLLGDCEHLIWLRPPAARRRGEEGVSDEHEPGGAPALGG